jgi:hypothetical protein
MGCTCDGSSTNLSTMSQLGCKLNGYYDDIVEWFYVPDVESKVCTVICNYWI